MILVIDNYDSFTWNLVHFLHDVGAACEVARNDSLSVEDALARNPDGIVLSPGPCTPNEAGICVDLVRSAPDHLPILGVCLGHQSIGAAFGGNVAQAKDILHGKYSDVTHENDPFFDGVPQTFKVVRYHSLSVIDDESLPSELSVTARTDDGEIMALTHKERPILGVQFHPESIGSEYGHTLLENFVKLTREPK